MRVSVQTVPWYREDQPYDSLAFIKECGFDAIDLSLNAFFKSTYDSETLTSFYDNGLDSVLQHYKPLKEAAAALDIEIFQAHAHFPVFFRNNPQKSEYLLSVAEKMIAVCNYLNCRNLVIHPFCDDIVTNQAGYDEEREINLSIYRRFMPVAKQHHVTICLENLLRTYHHHYYDAPCTDAKEACEYIDRLNIEAGAEVFGFCLDVGHLHASHRDPYKYILELGHRIKCLHLHENDGTCDSHLLPYSQKNSTGEQATLDWERVLKALREVGYWGTISFETFLGIRAFPEELRPQVLKLLATIGKHFAESISNLSAD